MFSGISPLAKVLIGESLIGEIRQSARDTHIFGVFFLKLRLNEEQIQKVKSITIMNVIDYLDIKNELGRNKMKIFSNCRVHCSQLRYR
jgi:hypothetical protein